MAVVWKVSPWDHQAHAFAPDKIGEVTAEAVCTHSAETRRLTEPAAVARRCVACLLVHGAELADQLGDRDRYPG